MTQLEVIRMIGNILTEIDVVVGSLVPGDPDLTRLQDLRRLLDVRQLILQPFGLRGQHGTLPERGRRVEGNQ